MARLGLGDDRRRAFDVLESPHLWDDDAVDLVADLAHEAVDLVTALLTVRSIGVTPLDAGPDFAREVGPRDLREDVLESLRLRVGCGAVL